MRDGPPCSYFTHAQKGTTERRSNVNSNTHKLTQGQEHEVSTASPFTKVVLIVDSQEDVQAAQTFLGMEAMPLGGRCFFLGPEHFVIVVSAYDAMKCACRALKWSPNLTRVMFVNLNGQTLEYMARWHLSRLKRLIQNPDSLTLGSMPWRRSKPARRSCNRRRETPQIDGLPRASTRSPDERRIDDARALLEKMTRPDGKLS